MAHENTAEQSKTNETKGRRQRPLSPHLQVYDLPMVSHVTLTHRITGILLSMSMLLFAALLLLAIAGEETYNFVFAIAHNWFGGLVIFCWLGCLYFHLVAGIRHLICDAGFWFDKKVAEKTSELVFIITAVLTVVTWGIVVYG